MKFKLGDVVYCHKPGHWLHGANGEVADYIGIEWREGPFAYKCDWHDVTPGWFNNDRTAKILRGSGPGDEGPSTPEFLPEQWLIPEREWNDNQAAQALAVRISSALDQLLHPRVVELTMKDEVLILCCAEVVARHVSFQPDAKKAFDGFPVVRGERSTVIGERTIFIVGEEARECPTS